VPRIQPGERLYAGHAGEGERSGHSFPEYVREKRGERRRKFPSEQSRTTIYLCNLDGSDVKGNDATGRVATRMEFPCRYVGAFFGLSGKVLAPLTSSERDKLVVRQDPLPQYSTGSIHSLMKKRKRKLKDAFAVVGVTMMDLYPEVSWNFVFGEVNPDKGVAVLSLARYHPEFEKCWKNIFNGELDSWTAKTAWSTLPVEDAPLFGSAL